MKSKLIIFDLFGTLIFSAGKIKKEEFSAFYQKLGIEFKTKEDVGLFSALFGQLMSQANSWAELGRKLLGKTIGEGNKEKIKKLTDFLKESITYQIFPDVKEIINLPCQKAILTSGSRFSFSNLGLEKNFEIFTPKETIFLKPDKRAFLAVLEKLGKTTKETVMVGDDLERDLIPAKNLGMEAILIDRENKIENPPVKKISSLSELKYMLI